MEENEGRESKSVLDNSDGSSNPSRVAAAKMPAAAGRHDPGLLHHRAKQSMQESPPPWVLLQLPKSGCGPGHAGALGRGSEVPAATAWPLPAHRVHSGCGARVGLSPGIVAAWPGGRMLRAVLTC